MNLLWRRAVPPLFALFALAGAAATAHAAAEVHKFNLVMTANPTSVDGGDFNQVIDTFNQDALRDRQGLERIGSGWEFDVELRYFVRPNFAVAAGVGQLRASSEREYLPGLTQDISMKAEILSAPIHLGADYYFTPYNQGDFQARFYAGGGLLSFTNTHALLEVFQLGTDTLTTIVDHSANPPLRGSFQRLAMKDGTGYYLEAGVHMFFAMRYSVMLGGMYRSAEVLNPGYYLDRNGYSQYTRQGTTKGVIDLGGVGARASVAIGF